VQSGPARPRRFQLCVVDIVTFLRSGVCTPAGTRYCKMAAHFASDELELRP
jgi:hypothetical protein